MLDNYKNCICKNVLNVYNRTKCIFFIPSSLCTLLYNQKLNYNMKKHYLKMSLFKNINTNRSIN